MNRCPYRLIPGAACVAASEPGRLHATPRRANIIFPGIGNHADQLGVNRIHLWKVLTGRRESRSLMARYDELTGGRA